MLSSPFQTPRMKMTRMPKKTLIAKRKLKEGYYDAGRRFCATQPFRSGQRHHLYALEQVLESGSPVFSRDRLYFITFFINLFVSNLLLSVKKSCLITENDSILSLSVCHKWNGSFTKRLHILIQRNYLRFCPPKVSLYINKVKSENGGYLPIVCSWFS